MDESIFHDRIDSLLLDLRREKKLSARKIADSLGLSEKTLSSYRRKNGNLPSVSTLVSLAEKLNVSTDYLLGITAEPSRNLDKKEIYSKTGIKSTSQDALSRIFKSFNPASLYEPLAPEVEIQGDFFEQFLNSENTVNCILSSKKFAALISELNTFFARYTFWRGTGSIKVGESVRKTMAAKAKLVMKENSYAYYQITQLFEKMITEIAESYLNDSCLRSEKTWCDHLLVPAYSPDEIAEVEMQDASSAAEEICR